MKIFVKKLKISLDLGQSKWYIISAVANEDSINNVNDL